MKNHKFITSFKNLMPLTTYSYVVESLDGNWPASVSPASGSFSTLTGSMDIETELSFCASSASCSGVTLLEYESDSCSSDSIPFADVRIALSLPYSNIKVYGNKEHFECEECLQTPIILVQENVNLDNITSNSINFPIGISGLNYYSTYNYTIELVDSNSLLGFTDLSGTITTNANSFEAINPKMILCENSGECSGYSTLGSISNCLDSLPYADIRVKITSDCLDYPIYSNRIHIQCDYCWPKINFDLLDGTAIVTDSNSFDLNVTISNLKPYQTYNYSITNIESNNIMAFEHLSGSFITDEETSYDLINKIIFCDVSGYYSNYNIINNNNAVCDLDKYVKFDITLDSDCLDNPVTSPINKIECDNCLPNRHSVVLFPKNIYQADSAIDINGTLDNLLLDHTYSYEFESKGGNWPIKIYPVSGSFIAKTPTKEILSQAWFCCPSGSCGSTPFTKTYDSLRYKTNYLTQDIRLKVTDTCANHLVYDDRTIFIQLADLEITPVNDTYNVILDSQTKGCYDFLMKVNNCINTHSYTYQYHAIDGNWPVILSNVSGSFTNQPLIHNIKTQLTFCPSTGVCNNQSNVLTPPSVLSYNSLLNSTCNNSKFISLQLSVTSNCYPNQKAFFSEPITVYCEDCIPLPSITLDIEK